MNKVFDSHMHINLKSNNPVLDFEQQLDMNAIEHAVLILNKPEENEILKRSAANLTKNFRERVVIAIYLDFRQDDIYSPANFWREKGWHVYIKIHPRISNIVSADFANLLKTLEKDKSDVIIVDCFGYGAQFENHIGIELGISLAKKFPQKKIVFAHAGGERLLQCMLYTRPLKNAFYDISLSCNYLFDTSIRADMIQLIRFNKNRVMYGSDYPDFLPQTAIEKTNLLCDKAGLTMREKQAIFYDNANEVYGSVLCKL